MGLVWGIQWSPYWAIIKDPRLPRSWLIYSASLNSPPQRVDNIRIEERFRSTMPADMLATQAVLMHLPLRCKIGRTLSSYHRSETDRLIKDCQANVYIENIGQYCGWLQSLSISSVIAHGLVLDQQGNRMSKAQGNVVAPRMSSGPSARNAVRLIFYAFQLPTQSSPSRYLGLPGNQ